MALILGIGIFQMTISRKEDSQKQNTYRQWERRLSQLNVTIDVEDDGHLYEWLDLPQWKQVFAYLESKPASNRSLRMAIESTFPEVLQ